MTDKQKPAYLVACVSTIDDVAVGPEYGELAAEPAKKSGLTPIAGGAVGSDKVKVLEGELPEGTELMMVEQFHSMEALDEFYYSEKYQEAIKYRLDGVKMHFLAALDGISAEELAATAEQAEQAKRGG
jgi:uncharacterized protein (DUF1330 family)